MENIPLYKWVDANALKHHCGVCARPLSHPAAVDTCFGPHAEPCPRFHKAMFMPRRGDTCQACKNVDAAHNKRHLEIAEQLRGVYTICGVDLYIGPVVEVRDGTGDTVVSHSAEEVKSGQTKKERKEAKKLAKAALRPKVVTVEELTYLDSVLHPRPLIDDANPLHNDQEVERIEHPLWLSAQDNNDTGQRKEPRGLPKHQEVGDDFKSEMTRILEVFQLTELFKKGSASSRKLRGRGLESIEKAADLFKSLVIEDLQLVKRDETETLMRRTGYLQYTSKSSFNIIQERFNSKSSTVGLEASTGGNPTQQLSKEDIAPSEAVDSPDRRHLPLNNQRLGSEESTDDCDSSSASPYKLSEGHGPRNSKFVGALPDQSSTQLLSLPRSEVAPLQTSIMHNLSRYDTSKEQSTPPYHGTPPLEQTKARLPSLVSPKKQSLKEFVAEEEEGEKDILEPSHPAVLSKKPKKKQCEAKRKAKAGREREGNTHAEGVEVQDPKEIKAMGDPKDHRNDGTKSPFWSDINSDVRNTSIESKWHNAEVIDSSWTLPKTLFQSGDLNSELPGKSHEPPIPIKPQSPQPDHAQFCTPQGCISPSPPDALAVATTSTVPDWTAYTRQFMTDDLTTVLFRKHCICHCPYLAAGFLDCQFDSNWPYGDPSEDIVGVVYPTDGGPIITRLCNRTYGQRLLSLFDEQSLTTMRMMIVDEGLIPFLYPCGLTPTSTSSPGANVEDAQPTRFESVIQRYYTLGQVRRIWDDKVKWEQMTLYGELAKDNNRRPIPSKTKLKQIQKGFEPRGVKGICYCQGPVDWPRGEGTVDCNHKDCIIKTFHRHCVRNFGPDSVTRWYCPGCEKRMEVMAGEVNERLGINGLREDLGLDRQCAKHVN